MPGFPQLRERYDLLVLGGGHAGLQAGLKAALLNHSAVVLDRGPKYSRSYYAPRMDNIPGFPNGVSGHKLLDLQIAAVRAHEDRVGYLTPARVTGARRTGAAPDGFEVTFDWLGEHRSVRGGALLLALGVVDRIPVVGGSIQPIFPWANFGLVDFCLFCDGHELTGRSVAVVGHDPFAVRTALDIRHFRPRSVDLLTHGHPLLEGVPAGEAETLREALDAAGIPCHTPEMVGFGGIREKRFEVRFADGSQRTFDRGFSALGWYDLHGEIPRSLGARLDPEGYVVTDEDGRVLSDATGDPIPGVYCAGDLRNGWNQIPEAWATAERAVIHAYAYYLETAPDEPTSPS
ncbi:MAG: NAD(P)/FAD-dependent oxidoreductase [Thermoplasmata archaeon]